MFRTKDRIVTIKGKTKKFTMTCKIDYTVYHTTKTAKIKKGDITLHYIDIMAMYCRIISPSI